MPAHHATQRATTSQQLDEAVAALHAQRARYSHSPIATRIELIEGCLEGIGRVARDWVDIACEAKGIPAKSPLRAEEILAGPIATVRYLMLMRQTLRDIQEHGSPRFPAAAYLGDDQRVYVPVVPVPMLFDKLTFVGFRADVRMREGITLDNLADHVATCCRLSTRDPAPIALVLGAGNVSSIPATDTFSKLLQEGSLVLLKMNPVNDYLGPLFERAFSPLIEQGCLRIIYGTAELGAAAIEHPLVDTVHITGSVESFHRIVWGSPRDAGHPTVPPGQPKLRKPISSELGNVSPWIVVPGAYSQRQLAFQARNVAASITNNASFNCIATKVLLTWRAWPDRVRFLELLQEALRDTPQRTAYYPGAQQRFDRFAGDVPRNPSEETLPWTLRCDIRPDETPHLLLEESFVCVCAEVALDALSPELFLQQAVDFANHRLYGTLGATVTIPPDFLRASNDTLWRAAVNRLRYGVVGINHWSGLAYALMSPPWGGYPDSTLDNVQSGMGWVHNTFMLQQAEKTILSGPLTMSPPPIWFAGHKHADAAAWSLLRLYQDPTRIRLLPLFWNAVRS